MTRRLPHQFRFQLVAKWVAETYYPCKALDIGGGKGLLTYLLNLQGWSTTVVDPVDQKLNWKYKDLESGKRIKIEEEVVPRIAFKFKKEMAKDFKLLIGLHAHGSNMAIIEAAQEFKCDFAIFPCCVIEEPIEKRASVNWINSLENYGKEMGHEVKKVHLNFVGQNVGLFTKVHF